jgi:aminoglycoside phosphotransferase (APT) family kinase protein
MTEAALDLSPEALSDRLGGFLQALWRRPVRLDGWRRYPAGFSWITIGFRASPPADAAGETLDLILRVGDPRGLLAPYRAEPEFRALEALQGVPGLPVPRVLAYSDDASVIGAPFLVTARVDGDTPMPWKGDAAQRDPAHNASLARDFTDALSALHRVDWRATALGRLWSDVDASRVALREVEHWAAHAELDLEGAHVPPQMHYARRWLARHAPPAQRITIVHGDFRVGNFLQRDGRITAVLDWELVHAGDPHEDLAWAGLRVFAAGTDRVGGLVERADFLRRYAERAGFEPRADVIRYYEVLGLFKSAAMLLGATRRIETGRAHDIRMASMGFQVAATLLEVNRLTKEFA